MYYIIYLSNNYLESYIILIYEVVGEERGKYTLLIMITIKEHRRHGVERYVFPVALCRRRSSTGWRVSAASRNFAGDAIRTTILRLHFLTMAIAGLPGISFATNLNHSCNSSGRSEQCRSCAFFAEAEKCFLRTRRSSSSPVLRIVLGY
jgi:hypothetical protein